jgi:hypothetical protein
MKQWSNTTSFRINATQIRTFLQIALPAGQRKVVGSIWTAVLPGDNVFDMKGTLERSLRDATVLATIASPLANLIR